ncbi:non-hydrolyzing UDP-N-acetylglucosamine 2-epimerase [Psychromicrobium sp. YIM B11713]|uniref:non-hydrolyzing UDP-N-acetylglucosamine 2-epimerase n=1 Tax=Psychromicrobium sp. YIM B11713 TaxID=3145233 RepID=UPI00374F1C4B
MKKIGIIFGTRPEAIKFAPIIREMEMDPRFELRLISTGQHREMLDQTMGEFGITPDVDLAVMTPGQTLTGITHRILERLEVGNHLAGLDGLLVHGDTATTLAGAIAGAQAQVPVIHVEAGLRSGSLASPFPEEANRKLVGQIAALHLAPTPSNAANLIREGIPENTIVVTGNTIVDALRWGTSVKTEYSDPRLQNLASDSRRVIVATTHRRESHGQPMVEIAHALASLAERNDIHIVVPLHLNPKVRDVLGPILRHVPNISLVEPLPYLEFCQLLQHADILLSDSSGAEEEGPALGKPTLVLRDRSERSESLLTGSSALVGRERTLIHNAVCALLDDPEAYLAMASALNPYGDGMAARRSVEAIAHFYALGPATRPFVPGAHEPLLADSVI